MSCQVISNNVALLHVSTQTSLCSLLLSLEAPNDVQSVAWHSYTIQGTGKGSGQIARMRRLFWAFAGRTYHIVGNLMPRLIIMCLIGKTDRYVATYTISIKIMKLSDTRIIYSLYTIIARPHGLLVCVSDYRTREPGSIPGWHLFFFFPLHFWRFNAELLHTSQMEL